MTAKPLTATIDASKTGEPISPYLYGQFIEHLGNLINHCLWAEMLDDRKFYFPITSQEPPETSHFPHHRSKRWKPIGPDAAVTMDRAQAYVGDHSPFIRCDEREPRGVQQVGLALRRGKRYVGRIIVAGDPGITVQVSLVWGAGPADRQTLTLAALQPAYAKVPLAFTAGADCDEGRIEIVGLGGGAFHIGAISLMPSDNIQGFRPDTIALLKQLKSAIYRFPGGNYVSNHDWMDAIGDPDRRPPRWDYAWDVMQPNDVGTDEVMVLCGLLGVEPYITVNAGYGDARSAANWVEYANGSVDTPMGRLRAANGHPEPYGVKWWGVGNEMYGWWQHGFMAPQHFFIKHNLFVEAMRRVDPTIKIIASGAAVGEMTVTINARRLTGKVMAEFGSDADWTGGLLTHCLDNLDVVSEHYYCHNNQRFDLAWGQVCDPGTFAGYVPVQEPLVEWARRPANRVRTKVEAYEVYYERIPGVKEKRVPMNIDEWAYTRMPPNLKMALSYAWALNEMFRHTDVIKMAAYTFATSCIEWNATDATFNAAGLLFKLYRDHFGVIPVQVGGNSPQPEPMYPVGGDQPRVNAGSPTYPLDVAAALTADGKALTVAVVNPTEEAREIAIGFQGVNLSGQGKRWVMTGPNLEAANELGKEPEIEIAEAAVDGIPDKLVVAPISITLYEFVAQ